MNDAAHARVSVAITAEPLAPVHRRVLSAEHCRGRVIASLEQDPAERFTRLVQKPIVENKQMIGDVLTEEFLLPAGLIVCRESDFFEVRHPNAERPEAGLAGVSRER